MSIVIARVTTSGYTDATHLSTVDSNLELETDVASVDYFALPSVNLVVWSIASDISYGGGVATWHDYVATILLEQGYVVTSVADIHLIF